MTAAEVTPTYEDFLRILRRSTTHLNEDPIREELFSVERLEHYAAYLAGELKISAKPKRGRSLSPAIRKSGRKLLDAYLALADAIRSKQPVSPAAEWFVDNFHIVEDQLREIKEDLPADYYSELPKLETGELKGYPRVYALSLAIIAHTDCRLDADTLKRFIRSFQQVTPLRIGEIWAVAITLRIALVEQLLPMAQRIVSARDKRAEADRLADRLLELANLPESRPADLLQMLSDTLGRPEHFDRAFIVQLIQRLRDQDPDVRPAFEWLETQLKAFETNTQQITQLEHHRQAAAQVTVGNLITSMRLLSDLDWKDFFESVSLVDPILARDPAGAYSKMDFATRDRYRHVIERLSKRTKATELEVARQAVVLAESGKGKAGEQRLCHVGYYLIGDGLPELERAFFYRPSVRGAIGRVFRRHPTFVYLGSLVAITAGLLFPALAYLDKFGADPWLLALFSLLAVFPASEFALSLINHYTPFFIKPRTLPKIETEDGLPDSGRTMVVVPTLFTSPAVARELVASLEVQYLANQDPNLYFALLGDFADSPAEHMPDDSALVEIVQSGLDELNSRYAKPSAARFFLFHRRRQWNPSEGKWIGWERKRGKIHEFNRLLRGAKNTSYIIATASDELMKTIPYVITLDSDTQLPRGSAHKLIGTILHPLNQPLLDPETHHVTAGYAILQPRVSISLGSAGQTRFSQIFSGNTGLDPYTTAVSDTYQDLFGEGSYTGKGLYVVDAFEAALADRVPENSLLSHDLFESSYARSALVTDVEFIDDYPANYDVFSKRQHRWIRGDWQILPWLLPKVPAAHGRRVPNRLTLISRWKILDNLRRSLVAPAVLLWWVLGWTVLPGTAAFWTLLIAVMLVFPIFTTVSNSILHRRPGVPWRGHFRSDWNEIRVQLAQIFLTITFLASQAWTQLDAIVRTLYRKLVSHKKLLEWMTFAQAQHQGTQKRDFWAAVGPGPVLSVVTLFLVIVTKPKALPYAAPFLLCWLATPWVKRWVSLKQPSTERPLGQKEIETYRRYARRTWHFFETFVSQEDNWLAPDNFQEDPQPVIAHRTSPTNIGLQLLSTASAYDFGYLGWLEFLESLERTFLTLVKLPRQHGHFFNWYDTLTLEPLKPRYISTVDSGNLAGHLLALKQACAELTRRPLLNPRARDGLIDTLWTLSEEARAIQGQSPSSGAVTSRQLQDVLAAALQLVRTAPWENLVDWRSFLERLSRQLNEADDILNALSADAPAGVFSGVLLWMKAAVHQVSEFQRDLTILAPWTTRPGTTKGKLGWTLLETLGLSPNGDAVAKDLVGRREKLMGQCDELALGMNFRFLFDEQRKIFVIGYNVTDGRRDNSFYDLLASESRLTSFVAIAKGEVPQEHWFRLGRKMTNVQRSRALISWTATMFEYLMPLLVMKRYPETLLEQTYKAIVTRQIEYGNQRGVPWGISEAGYNARDLSLAYQYGPFGVPGLGLKRGLSHDLVVSPYSTMLAAVIVPWEALANLQRLASLGALARYGFYESIDYTPERLPAKQKSVILRSFLAHHQGMSLVALNNLLHDGIMQKRFHQEPLVQATQILLQERIPHSVPITRPRAEEVDTSSAIRFWETSNPRVYSDVNLPTPRTQLLSNGYYSVMVTTAGSGYSRCGPLAVSRWREDVTRDNWGHYFYIRNRTAGGVWSAGYHPTGLKPDSYEVTFAEDKVDIRRRDAKTTTHTEIIVSPEDNVELRRISLTNHSSETCEYEVTSLMETVIAKPSDDIAHPAFSNLFVQTELLPKEGALLATRRKRSQSENQVWAFHVLVTEGDAVGSVQYETDRSRFLGRGRDASDAFVIHEDRPLSNTVGAVLDPIFSLRQSIRIPPGETMRVLFTTGVAGSRDDAVRIADKYHDIHIFAREAELAWTKTQVQLRHLNISTDMAHTFQRLAGRIIYSDPSLRPRSHSLARNTKAQSSLWRYGISGDLPIVLTRISEEKDMAMVRQLLHGHEYLRLKGLEMDLVILNERPVSYLQELQEELQRQIRMSGAQTLLDKPGGVYIRRTDIMPEEDVILLQTVARVNLSAGKGTLDEQVKRRPVENLLPDRAPPRTSGRAYPELSPPLPELEFFNGLGGFTAGGRQYVTILKAGQWTPAPWINVIANEKDFGFLASESGSGFTWSVNSRENRLTPWSNDAVSDPPGEAIYIRDEETGKFWTPTPLPVREPETYVIRHGQGYTEYEHVSHGISQHLRVFVPLDSTVKISHLRLKNLSEHDRKLSVTSYAEWVLGTQRGSSAPFVVTEIDPATSAIFARNPYNNEFASRVAFADISEKDRSFTCDRKVFMGRNRSPAKPAALKRVGLSGLFGAGLDPCAAFQTHFDLAPGEEKEIVILLGEAASAEGARALLTKYRDKAAVADALDVVLEYWEETLSTIEIHTPDLAMNTIMNRWLLYQTLVCRLWARSAFYQSGGAYGFRDQLQDVMALIYSRPNLAREQILRAAARQFKEGDVQHWWHPPTGRGVRTHFSDDLLWLPYVVSFYVNVTGDRSLLEEVVPFLDAEPLAPGQEDSYLQPQVSAEKGTILEHCARSLDRSLKVGAHGLPLMGSGDWNDGMNRVGHQGQGESVWVGWFLFTALKEFIPFCDAANDTARSTAYRRHMEDLRAAIELSGWDGNWYKRAFFDDGAVLGSAANEECKIDSIAQSWAVLSGAGNPQRTARAMAAVDEYLVHRGDGLVKLFTPPFDTSPLDPGYIKGYVPGVRENGGQYTHAAIWTLMAFAALGDGDKAGELYALINPINHSSTRAGLHKYKVEPYVAAADVYGLWPHVGRGGWTWYTGSASWLYRAALESILGFELRGDKLRLHPCLPTLWRHFEITYRRGATKYRIFVEKDEGLDAASPPLVELDGKALPSDEIPLVADGREHTVRVRV